MAMGASWVLPSVTSLTGRSVSRENSEARNCFFRIYVNPLCRPLQRLRKAADGIVPPREAVNGRATAYEQSFLQIDVEEKFQVH